MKKRYIPSVRRAYQFGWDWQVEQCYATGRNSVDREGWAPAKRWAEGAARRSAASLQAKDDAYAAPWSEVPQ